MHSMQILHGEAGCGAFAPSADGATNAELTPFEVREWVFDNAPIRRAGMRAAAAVQ
jgi:hypothetical protein